jgi:hypothetical protein
MNWPEPDKCLPVKMQVSAFCNDLFNLEVRRKLLAAPV